MSLSKSPLTHPLKTARGLGSAKDGTHHWIMQRLSAIALVPLVLWFVWSFLHIMIGASRSTAADWFASPFNAIGTGALLLALFYHAKLGLQVVIEDYVHCACAKTALLVGLNLFSVLLMLISAVAVIKLHIMGI